MSISLDAVAAKTVERVLTLLFTQRCCYMTFAQSLPSPCLELTGCLHDWSVSWVVRGGGGNTGRRYCLCGAGYTTVRTIQLLFYWKCDFVRGIGVCELYVYMGYKRENTVLAHADMTTIQLKNSAKCSNYTTITIHSVVCTSSIQSFSLNKDLTKLNSRRWRLIDVTWRSRVAGTWIFSTGWHRLTTK